METAELTSNRMARRERIVNAAMSLATQGYDSCQMRSVATAAGVSASTVYQYFPSKDDLLLACFHDWLWGFDPASRADGDHDPYEGLLQVALSLTERLCSSPQFAEAMVRPYLYADGTAATQADLVRRQTVRIFIESVGGAGSAPREIGAAEVLSDVWMANVAAFAQRRISAGQLTERLTRTVGLLKG
ncbi:MULTISPECIES: TetR family transcriptional regulator [Mycolicibacterium]|uniref:TetR family transcriptional regulator n=1 Tax=Mycolicibacterium farcinogenes TaxID=1802 RepID=A0ACD1FFL7_MYCFR|nr:MULTISPECIES: TetR family transcriptional regulator [Mycolicibacterium]QZH62523.1 TetR family transcriptional regulator [Mycolicibacterium farcinogenes]QZH65722.1 TetR family transcriptional regulator [Mycolicibacterium farcinogenes]